MADNSKRWAAVGSAVSARMRDRAMSQADVVRDSGVSSFTVRKVMNGEANNYRGDRLAKIAVSLGWTADSIDRILAGHDPVERDDGETTIADSKINEMFQRIDAHEERLDNVEYHLGVLREMMAEIKAEVVGDPEAPQQHQR